MIEPNRAPNDPLEAMLAANDQRDADDALREAVFTRTIGVMRRRRRMKRCVLAASLLCCYLAGMATVGVWRPGGEASTQVAKETTTAKPRPRKVSPRTLPKPAASRSDLVVSAQPSGFESWRRIGDHYLRESDDIALAVAGYSRALDLASDKELAISPGQDNWLLMALKDARVKERRNAYSEQN
jgi:hypothetical protein